MLVIITLLVSHRSIIARDRERFFSPMKINSSLVSDDCHVTNTCVTIVHLYALPLPFSFHIHVELEITRL